MFWIISIVDLFLMMELPYENMLDFYIWIIMEIFMSYMLIYKHVLFSVAI
jgi:hypothetical protein